MLRPKLTPVLVPFNFNRHEKLSGSKNQCEYRFHTSFDGTMSTPGSSPSHQQRAKVQIDDRREVSECEWVRKERWQRLSRWDFTLGFVYLLCCKDGRLREEGMRIRKAASLCPFYWKPEWGNSHFNRLIFSIVGVVREIGNSESELQSVSLSNRSYLLCWCRFLGDFIRSSGKADRRRPCVRLTNFTRELFRAKQRRWRVS